MTKEKLIENLKKLRDKALFEAERTKDGKTISVMCANLKAEGKYIAFQSAISLAEELEEEKEDEKDEQKTR